MPRRKHAFTLVELLVVIGIIALLISILLPALNRSKQAANLVDCQARLSQIGLAVHLYTSQNRGLLPWGGVNNTAPWTDSSLPNSTNQEPFWWWYFTLSEITNKNIMGPDALVRNLSPLFRDRDTIDAPSDVRYTMHYTANPRVLYRADVPDRVPRIFYGGEEIEPQQRSQRKASTVRRPSGVFMIWDAPQLQDYSYNAYGLAEAIDAWGWDNTSGLVADPPVNGYVMNRAILPGQLGVTGRQPGNAFQVKYNFDAKTAFGAQGWLSHLRFRHMNNKKLAALCVDGHVETRDVGSVMCRDIFTNYK